MFAIFLEFLTHQYLLVGAWLSLLFLILHNESRKTGRNISPQQISDLINKQDGLVIDLRDSSEFRQGHITGSLNIPFRDLAKRSVELDSKKKIPIVVVCKIGQDAPSASKQLKNEGFETVFKLAGGIGEWTAASFPLVNKKT